MDRWIARRPLHKVPQFPDVTWPAVVGERINRFVGNGVEQAKKILRTNSDSLIDIALDCGFSSHAHFSNTFRQIVGVTPSEYRGAVIVPICKKVSFRKQLLWAGIARLSVESSGSRLTHSTTPFCV